MNSTFIIHHSSFNIHHLLPNILFLTLKVFSATGGIEKVCCVAGKALYEQQLQQPRKLQVMSMHDRQQDADDNPYFPAEIFRGYGGRKTRFVIAAIKAAATADTILLSHINLLVIGWIIKKRYPNKRLLLFAHGIEIWEPLPRRKLRWLNSCDNILCVSRYTAEKIQAVHGIAASTCIVFNNCLDPYLPLAEGRQRDPELRQRYGIGENDEVLFALTRLSSKERYKGYDKVIMAMVPLVKTYPGLKYILAGRYDDTEKTYLDKLIQENGLEGKVIMPGFVAGEDLARYFRLADAYVMPSRKEGFGIVFIEAMYYGLPVIAGNTDGSSDALLNGELGLLVDPENVTAIGEAIEKILMNKKAFSPDREMLMEHFGYPVYKEKMADLFKV